MEPDNIKDLPKVFVKYKWGDIKKNIKEDINKAIEDELISNYRLNECPIEMLKHAHLLNRDVREPIYKEMLSDTRLHESLPYLHGFETRDDNDAYTMSNRLSKLIDQGFMHKYPI